MIEDAKAVLTTWGAADPNFLLCNSKLTFQMTMTPEKTQYLTQVCSFLFLPTVFLFVCQTFFFKYVI